MKPQGPWVPALSMYEWKGVARQILRGRFSYRCNDHRYEHASNGFVMLSNFL